MNNREMDREAICLVAKLKVCAQKKDLPEGCRIHSDIAKRHLLHGNVFIGCALVNMYGKCGALEKAEELFDELVFRDVATWTALIAGYGHIERGHEALERFERMQRDGLFPNALTFCCILKACGSIRAVERGIQMHACIAHNGFFVKNTMLGTALVDMYAKCGKLTNAKRAFDELLIKDVVSWTALIRGYVQHSYNQEALNCFEWMQKKRFLPNAVTFSSVLQACASVGATEKGKEVHVEILRQGLLQNDDILGTALVDMYAKCGELDYAEEVFDQLMIHNVFSWTALITGYCLHGCATGALHHFGKMQQEGHSPNAVTLTCILKACCDMGAAAKGKEIHAEISRRDLWGTDCVLDNSLIDMYMECGAMAMAEEVFNTLEVHNVVSWNMLISGYCLHENYEAALCCFSRMKIENHIPDKITFHCILQACSVIEGREKGKEMHAEIHGRRLDGFLGNALVNMYVKCGTITSARRVFDELSVRDIEIWNALVAGYCNHDHSGEALTCFTRMIFEGLYWDEFSFSSALKACSALRAIQKGREIHVLIVTEDLLEKDAVLGTALVDMYAECDLLEKAQQTFRGLLIHDEISWTTLISAYSRHGCSIEALEFFNQMQFEGVCPDSAMLSSVLSVCSSIGALEKGEQIHANFITDRLLEMDSMLGASLVHMYAECGALTKAEEVFSVLPSQNVAVWTALIAGYAQTGKHEIAFNLFAKMLREGIEPNFVTFIVLLNTCSFLGLVAKGIHLFDTMNSHDIFPTLEHYTCVVNLFSRTGFFDSAMAAVKNMAHCHHLPVWFALLSACRKWGNVELGKFAFRRAVELNKKL